MPPLLPVLKREPDVDLMPGMGSQESEVLPCQGIHDGGVVRSVFFGTACRQVTVRRVSCTKDHGHEWAYEAGDRDPGPKPPLPVERAVGELGAVVPRTLRSTRPSGGATLKPDKHDATYAYPLSAPPR